MRLVLPAIYSVQFGPIRSTKQLNALNDKSENLDGWPAR
jgi:hypothetical protein